MMQTLPQQLACMLVVGNAHDDGPLFEIADAILHGDYPLSDKLDALRKIDEAIGETGEYTQEAIDAYLADCAA